MNLIEDILESDRFREISSFSRPDPRYEERFSFEQFHELIASLHIHERVPFGVRVQFENVKNLFLYSYCCYRFSSTASKESFNTLELALKEKIENEKVFSKNKGLQSYLKIAIEKKWITDTCLSNRDRYQNLSGDDDQEICKRLLNDYIPGLRNTLNHGSTYLNLPGFCFSDLRVCVDIINALFLN